MTTHKIYALPYKRRRNNVTNYQKRLKLLLARKPRLVVRETNKHMIVQLTQYVATGDKVIISMTTSDLKKFGWNLPTGNLPSAYLIGLAAGQKAKQAGIDEAILDIGLHTSVPGSKIYAALKGALDAGLTIPHAKDVLPKDERLKGTHTKNAEAAKIFDDIKKNIMRK